MSTKINDSNGLTLEKLLETSNDVKIYTCEDFKGNIEVTINDLMYLFYSRSLLKSHNPGSQSPVQSFDMNIESKTPGIDNFIRMDLHDKMTAGDKLEILISKI